MKTQIWIAIGVYVLVAIAKKLLTIEASLYSFLQVIGLSQNPARDPANQLFLVVL